MTRVSENSIHGIFRHGLGVNKQKMEDLQIKGMNLKSMTRPSDSPIDNVESLALRSRLTDNHQYLRNIEHAILNLNATEKSLERMTDVMVKIKEIAVAQSSDFYNRDVKKSIANEVKQLRNDLLAISNQRIGAKYLFSGFKSLTRPFLPSGEYVGDEGQINLEVSKDFFVPINLNGREIFYSLEKSENDNFFPSDPSRDLASVPEEGDGDFERRLGIFQQLDGFISALENGDTLLVQSLLEKFDDSINHLITLRTQIGAISNSVENSRTALESENIEAMSRKSKLEDADVIDLFSEMAKQKNVLKTSYQAGKELINKSLLDFIR